MRVEDHMGWGRKGLECALKPKLRVKGDSEWGEEGLGALWT